MVLSSTICMAIMLYHEARGTTIQEQIQIAQVAQNRSMVQNKQVCNIVLDGNQFNWSKNYKPKYKFKSSDDMLKYYNITDGNSWITALGVSSMSKLHTTQAYYYHDNSICSFNKNMMAKIVVVNKTKNFTFYK